MGGYEVIRSIVTFSKVVHHILFDLPLFSFFIVLRLFIAAELYNALCSHFCGKVFTNRTELL